MQDKRHHSVYIEIIAVKLGEMKIKKQATAPKDRECSVSEV